MQYNQEVNPLLSMNNYTPFVIRGNDKNNIIKGTVSRDFFASGSFYESVFPQPQSIPVRPFRIFSKIRGDIRSSRFATGVNDTGGK